MQVVSWNPSLTTAIQHDSFIPLVERILTASEKLAVFSTSSSTISNTENRETITIDDYLKSPSSLNFRGAAQRARFERPNAASRSLSSIGDCVYDSRDRLHPDSSQANVSYLVRLIRMWPSKLPLPQHLGMFLQSYQTIGGFNHPFSGLTSLMGCMDIDLGMDFGSVAEFCRQSTYETRYSLMYVLALAAFRRVEVDIFRVWLAFAFFDELKNLNGPAWQSYSHFHMYQHPNRDGIARLLDRVGLTSLANVGVLDEKLRSQALQSSAVIDTNIPFLAQYLVVSFVHLKAHPINGLTCPEPISMRYT